MEQDIINYPRVKINWFPTPPPLKKEKNKLPESVFRVKKISIKSTEQKSGSVVVDDFKVMKTPLNIRVSDKKLKIIVGKERHF